MELSFTVYGTPQQRGSKRAFSVGGKARLADANAKSKPWMAAVSHAAGEAMGDRELITGPVRLDVAFLFSRIKSHYHTGKRSSELREGAPVYRDKAPDLDKLIRSIGDALTGVVYRDDSQVVEVQAVKIFTDGAARAEITVNTLS